MYVAACGGSLIQFLLLQALLLRQQSLQQQKTLRTAAGSEESKSKEPDS
jgi:hypothetical protein